MGESATKRKGHRSIAERREEARSTPTRRVPLIVVGSTMPSDSNATLERAARTGDADRITELLKDGMNPGGHEITKEDTALALYWTAYFGHVGAAQRLLDAGANPDGKEGDTALIAAAKQRHLDLVNLLVERGADLEAKDSMGLTALFHAVRNANTEGLKALVEAGADLNVTARNGQRPVDLASQFDRADELYVLLQAGADADAGESKIPPKEWARQAMTKSASGFVLEGYNPKAAKAKARALAADRK